jgi:hypothetical protein
MNYREFDPYNDESFWDEVQRDSDARRAAPLQFALDAIEDLFRHESDKERGFIRWQRKLEQSIWWADDALHCLENVIANSPLNLGEILREHGINIWVQTPDGEAIGDSQAHVEWLRNSVLRMRGLFEKHVAAKRFT